MKSVNIDDLVRSQILDKYEQSDGTKMKLTCSALLYVRYAIYHLADYYEGKSSEQSGGPQLDNEIDDSRQ